VRCDIPANVYQCTFAPNTQWTEEVAQGGEIRDYWQGLARKYDVYRYVKLGQRIERIEWDDSVSQWVLTIRNVQSSEVYREKADFVLPAIGRFNAWRLPDIPGIQDYEGLIRHSSNWDPTFDATRKDVAVIGNGASGVQLVPNLQKVVNHLDHYARSKTWIAGSFAGDERTFEPQYFSPEKLKSFTDPVEYLQFRKGLEEKYWRRFGSTFRGSKENEDLRENFIQVMAKRLEKKPELLDSMVPDFSPHCRRLTPGPGYLEALCADNVEFIWDPIKRFTAHGIETKDGKVRNVDAVFCATGANTDMIPPFPIISRGVDLQTAWKHDGKFGFPYTYLGLATPGFPNLLFVGGPHGNGPSGTLPYSMETQLTYYAKLLRKVSSQRIKSIVPLKKAADNFVEYSDAFFPTTVLSENCSSWANGGRPGARIHGLWPGSAAHVTFVRRDPRWEDWEYEYLSSSGNRFAYFGNGWTQKELDLSSDMTSYLRSSEDIDLRTIHESWL
jgi:cation diffusion facilitator CzcD-associated flavoprotein CzcO